MDAVLVLGDPRLRVACAPVGDGYAKLAGDIDRLCAALTAVRNQHGFGRGLAAPQIGIARRIIAIDLGGGPFAVIDPEVSWRSDERFEVWDDCFSVPDRLVRVERHCSISLSYRDRDRQLRTWTRLPPDLAELMQHEIDHLDGVLMTDRALAEQAAGEGREVLARPARQPLTEDQLAQWLAD